MLDGTHGCRKQAQDERGQIDDGDVRPCDSIIAGTTFGFSRLSSRALINVRQCAENMSI
jgi:hypothetical protein